MGVILNTNYDFEGEILRKKQLAELEKNSNAIKKYNDMLEEFNKMNKHLGSITGKEI